MSSKGRGPLARLGKLFLQGLAAVLPLGLTLYLLWWMGSTAEQVFGSGLRAVLPEGVYVPGLGLVVGAALVVAVGFVLKAWWARSLWRAAERLFEHIPLVKTIYGSVKDLMTFFAGSDERKQLEQVVVVRMGDPPMGLVGLVTSEHARDVTGREEDAEQVAVYLPMSYQIGGFMVLVPRDAIESIDLSVEDALRTVVTAGLSNRSAGTGTGIGTGQP